MHSKHKQSMVKLPIITAALLLFLVAYCCWCLPQRHYASRNHHHQHQQVDLIKLSLQPMAERTPGLGHLWGAAHKLAGDTQRAREVQAESSRDIVVTLAHKAAGDKAATLANWGLDSYVTLANSLEAGQFKPYGSPKYIYQVLTGNLTLEEHIKHMVTMTRRRIKGKKREKLTESKKMLEEMLKDKKQQQ